MLNYNSIQELVDKALESGKCISELVLEDQSQELGCPAEEIYNKMACNLNVMRESVSSGLQSSVKSPSGLGGNVCKLKQAIKEGRSIGGELFNRILTNAMAVAELNACMGKIVAAPTAGSCGILPSVLLTIADERKISEKQVVMSLFTAAGIGLVIARQASISGAEGGCQAECGSASAMAAGAAVEILGGTPDMVAHACAIALKNVLGLVCDPVAGLVEVPCVKRNAAGAVNALAAADMALAGIESVIPADEVIGAMKSVGNLICTALKETAEGGLAATPTAKKLEAEIFGRTRCRVSIH